MAAQKEPEKKNIDIFLVAVIVLMVLAIGGALWLTGKSVLTRLDAIEVKMSSQNQQVASEVFELRKQLQSLEFVVKKLAAAQGIKATPVGVGAAEPAAQPAAEPAGKEPAGKEPAK